MFLGCFVFIICFDFFFNDTATTEIYTLSLHDALPIWISARSQRANCWKASAPKRFRRSRSPDRKSGSAGMPRPISYAVFCLKKKQTRACRAGRWCRGCATGRGGAGPRRRARTRAASARCPPCGRAGWCRAGPSCFFFFNDTAPTEIYTLSLHDALPILKMSELSPVELIKRESRGLRGTLAESLADQIGRAGQQECRDRYRMPACAC